VEGAGRDYGVVADPGGSVDVAASDALRARLRAERPDREPMFDRGPGYPDLAGGATSSPYDWNG
jgi:N-methylhydantoinase B